MSVTPTLLLTPKTTQSRLMARWEMARRDPLMFLRWFVITNMAVERQNIEAPFPWSRPHIANLTRVWQENPLLAIKKCRQVLMTWWAAALAVWECVFHDGRLIMLQSMTFEDAVGDETVGDGPLGRAKYILERIPAKSLLGVEMNKREGRVTFPRRRSTLWAIAQGGDKIRQHTSSGIVSDECAFQPEFGDALMAAIPTIRSGGWFLAISTADLSDGGCFMRLVNDMPDEDVA